MTRKDFNLIAETIRDLGPVDTDVATIAAAFALRLQATNPRFDEERFLRACGFADAQHPGPGD